MPHGEVTALARQGKTGLGSQAPRGGVVVTAGGLILAGTSSDRKFRAYDRDNGKVLWEIDLPAASEGIPAVYEVDGRQYIAIATGGNGYITQPCLATDPPIRPSRTERISGVCTAEELTRRAQRSTCVFRCRPGSRSESAAATMSAPA